MANPGMPNPGMSSPGMIPPPPPPSPRSMAGPVVLILVGVVFLLMTMGVIDRFSFGRIFAHYWPLLLILWGIIRLVEHEQAKRAGLPGRGIGVGGVFLVLFIVVAGLIATEAARVNWRDLGEHIQGGDDQNLDDWWGGGQAYDYSDDLSKEFPSGGSLHINNERGTISINPSDDGMIKVSVRKTIRADKQSDADNYNTKTKPDITINDK